MGNSKLTCQRLANSDVDYSSSTNSSHVKASIGPKAIGKDHFKIIKVIGRGSFGKVFLVQKKDSGKIFAMKVLRKDSILQRNQIEHTKCEREILQKINSPFLVHMHYAFQTPEKLYMIVDFLNGGELFFHLRREVRFDEDRIRFYACEIILAIQCLHQQGIVYRDLKPENILLDQDGHIKLTDFGLSKQGIIKLNSDQTFTICGTPEYLAPEIIRGEGHDKAVDWWSLGTLLFEMNTGRPPFQNSNKMQLLYTIATTKVSFDKLRKPSPAFKDLIRRLCTHDPLKRLGGADRGAQEVMAHPYFANISWEALIQRKVTAPFIPNAGNKDDTCNIDKVFLTEKPVDSPVDWKLTSSQQKKAHFTGFTYDMDQEYIMEQAES